MPTERIPRIPGVITSYNPETKEGFIQPDKSTYYRLPFYLEGGRFLTTGMSVTFCTRVDVERVTAVHVNLWSHKEGIAQLNQGMADPFLAECRGAQIIPTPELNLLVEKFGVKHLGIASDAEVRLPRLTMSDLSKLVNFKNIGYFDWNFADLEVMEQIYDEHGEDVDLHSLGNPEEVWAKYAPKMQERTYYVHPFFGPMHLWKEICRRSQAHFRKFNTPRKLILAFPVDKHSTLRNLKNVNHEQLFSDVKFRETDIYLLKNPVRFGRWNYQKNDTDWVQIASKTALAVFNSEKAGEEGKLEEIDFAGEVEGQKVALKAKNQLLVCFRDAALQDMRKKLEASLPSKLIFQEKSRGKNCPTFSIPLADESEGRDLLEHFGMLNRSFCTTTDKLYNGTKTFTILFKPEFFSSLENTALLKKLFGAQWFWPITNENQTNVWMGAFETDLEWEKVLLRAQSWNQQMQATNQPGKLILELRLGEEKKSKLVTEVMTAPKENTPTFIVTNITHDMDLHQLDAVIREYYQGAIEFCWFEDGEKIAVRIAVSDDAAKNRMMSKPPLFDSTSQQTFIVRDNKQLNRRIDLSKSGKQPIVAESWKDMTYDVKEWEAKHKNLFSFLEHEPKEVKEDPKREKPAIQEPKEAKEDLKRDKLAIQELTKLIDEKLDFDPSRVNFHSEGELGYIFDLKGGKETLFLCKQCGYVARRRIRHTSHECSTSKKTYGGPLKFLHKHKNTLAKIVKNDHPNA